MPAGAAAIACANDLLALGVLQELTQRGVRVPADVPSSKPVGRPDRPQPGLTIARP